jgi:predicted sulfurtransferase
MKIPLVFYDRYKNEKNEFTCCKLETSQIGEIKKHFNQNHFDILLEYITKSNQNTNTNIGNNTNISSDTSTNIGSDTSTNAIDSNSDKSIIGFYRKRNKKRSDPINYKCNCSNSQVLLFYNYLNIENPLEIATKINTFNSKLTGKVRIGKEGFNITIAGSIYDTNQLINYLVCNSLVKGYELLNDDQRKEFYNLYFKPSVGCVHVFNGLSIKIVNEICVFNEKVVDYIEPHSLKIAQMIINNTSDIIMDNTIASNIDNTSNNNSHVGSISNSDISGLSSNSHVGSISNSDISGLSSNSHVGSISNSDISTDGISKKQNNVYNLSPKEFHSHISNLGNDTVILDVRNYYESKIGHFRDAILPPTRKFSNFPMYFKKHINYYNQKKNILAYCTGGIRCEKASRFIINNTNANVFVLEGGIHNYLNWTEKENVSSFFLGSNYVFDSRKTLGNPTQLVANCRNCDTKTGNYTKCHSSDCHLIIEACHSCIEEQLFCCDDCKNGVSGDCFCERERRKVGLSDNK